MTPVRLKPTAPGSRVKHTTEPLRSPIYSEEITNARYYGVHSAKRKLKQKASVTTSEYVVTI